MIVKAPEPKFPPAPQGSYPSVCVDIIDLGKVENKMFGGERLMVRIVWQIDETMDDDTADQYKMPRGSRYIVKQDYTASLDEKAKLRKHLQSWRGRVFTSMELMGFDMETVIGVPCLLSIVHNSGNKGGTFANVESVMKPPKGMEAIRPEGYIRVKDRKPEEPIKAPKPVQRRQLPPEELPADPYAGMGITDDDVPF